MTTMRPAFAKALLAPAMAVFAVVAAAGMAQGAPAQRQQGSPVQVDRPLHVVRGAPGQARIADDRGRQVLLRGVNVNQLGDYYQTYPDLEPTFPLTERDFERIASLGFNVVRLVLSWSALEPEPGQFDADYLARIEQAVAWAKQHGIYVVLDMHQDAWGKFIATPPEETCPAGLQPAIGWDGAPEWATYTGGLTTCTYGGIREASPAVAQAFTNFWRDRAGPDGTGIQQHLVQVWAWLARNFADEPAVAGYDLLNEPHPGFLPVVTAITELGRYYDRAIEAIRDAEEAAGGFHHIVFFEPIGTWSATGAAPPVQPAFTDDPNIVFAPHLYAGSLTVTPDFGIADGYRAANAAAAGYRTTFWGGEWGWFGDPQRDADEVARFAQLQDEYAVGGAWWSWRQACGDPHQIRAPGRRPARISPSLVRYRCPGNVELGVPEPFATILSRPYPRAAPGRITELESDPEAVTMHLEGRAGDVSGGRVDLWVPGQPGTRPVVTGTNISAVRVFPVDGGFRVTATATGRYTLDLHLAATGS